MSRRRSTSHAFGVISGLLIAPAGLAGALLIGTASPSLSSAATNPCATQLTAVSKATDSPKPSASKTPTASHSPSPSSTSKKPTPSPSPSTSHTHSPSPSTTPSPSPSTTVSPSPSPSPSPSSTAPDHLCITVQALANHVQMGASARYAVWVWLAGKVNGTAKVAIEAKPAKLSPSFTVCATPGTAVCSVSLTAGRSVELRAAVAVPQQTAGTRLTLTATGVSPQAAATASASASVLVAAAPTPTPTPTPTPVPAGTIPVPSGIGATLPVGTVPSGSLPPLPTPEADPGLTFPTVSPASPAPDPSQTARPIRVTDVSASFPLDTRVIGGQIVGLAVLAAAVIIAVAQFSFRKQRPQQGRDHD
jgi:hypothetical protein